MKQKDALLLLIVFIALFLLFGGRHLIQKATLETASTTPASEVASTTNATASTTPKNQLLTQSQIEALQKLGIDVNKLPTTITPALKACFEEKLGVQRVNEIKGGSAPTVSDFLKVKSCLES